MSIIIKKDENGKHIIDLNGTEVIVKDSNQHISLNMYFNENVVSEVNNGIWQFEN